MDTEELKNNNVGPKRKLSACHFYVVTIVVPHLLTTCKENKFAHTIFK